MSSQRIKELRREMRELTEASPRKRKKRRLPIVLGPAQVAALHRAIEAALTAARTPRKRFAAQRDRVMVMVGFLSGLRVSELCNLDVSDVELLAPEEIRVRGGKGDKDRNVPLSEELLPALKAWVGDRRTGPLFTGPGGRRLAPRTFQARLDALGKAAGIVKVKHVHPHLMRHTFATDLLQSGSTITEVQELLGHASIQTTAIYLHVDTSRLKRNVDRLPARFACAPRTGTDAFSAFSG